MTENECLDRMIAPGTLRPGKYRSGVIQILATRACDKSCYGCTQGSNLAGKVEFMSPENYEKAVLSLKGYFGVYGLFGGNPALSPHFKDYCDILKKHVPANQRGIWCNHPKGNGKLMREVFDPAISNLNVHLDKEAYAEFKRDWPESRPVGLSQDSRHSPPFVASKDVISDEGERWNLISKCPINIHWSSLMGMFRGQLRAWFCEIAGSQSMLHQHEEDYPDTGLDPTLRYYLPMEKTAPMSLSWWQLPMVEFRDQVKKHCHDCGVPMQGYGELAMTPDDKGKEQVSQTHASIYKAKRKGRAVELVMARGELGKPLASMVDYIGNASK